MKTCVVVVLLLVSVALAQDNSDTVEKRSLLDKLKHVFDKVKEEFNKLKYSFNKLVNDKLDIQTVADKLKTYLTDGEGQQQCITVCISLASETLHIPKVVDKKVCPLVCKVALAFKKD